MDLVNELVFMDLEWTRVVSGSYIDLDDMLKTCKYFFSSKLQLSFLLSLCSGTHTLP